MHFMWATQLALPCRRWQTSPECFAASERLQMPEDQGKASSLLSFCDSSHSWLDHLVVSMSHPCLEATSASPYRLNRLNTLSLESGAALRTLELCKGTGNVLLAAATTQDAGWWSVKPTKWKVVGSTFRRKPGGRGEPTCYRTLQHLCGLFLCFLMFPACVLLPPVCAIPQIKSWSFSQVNLGQLGT